MCAKEYFFKLSFRSTTLPFIPFCLLQWLISIFLLCSHVAETGLPHVAQVLSTEEIPETALRQRSLELQTRRHQRHRRRRRSCTAEAASVVQLLNRRRRFGPTSAGTRELRRLQFADGHSLRHPQRPRLRSSNSGRTTSPCLDRCTATTSTATTTWWRKAWTRRSWPRGWTMAATSWQPR